jgi:DNA-directed RNA polymerase subunit M/transcription elongation factor TFIIS
VVSLANFCPNCGESLSSKGTTKGEVRKTARRAFEKRPKKRKASAYNKRYATAYKRLKKKHPRTSFGALAKKAHKLARRK